MIGKIAGSAIFIGAVVVLSVIFIRNDDAADSLTGIVAYINKEPVGKEEFLLLAKQMRGSREEKGGKLSEPLKEQVMESLDIIRIYELTEPSMNNNGGSGEGERNEANGRIEALLEQMQSGGILFMKLYDSRKGKPGLTGVEVIEEDNYRDMAKYRSGYYELAARLQPGEIGMVEENGVKTILYCDARTEGGYLSFGEVREEVMLRYEDKSFGDYLKGLGTGIG